MSAAPGSPDLTCVRCGRRVPAGSAGPLGPREGMARIRRQQDGWKRIGAFTCLAVGGLFAIFAAGCFVAAVPALASGDPDTGQMVFGLFWVAMAGAFIFAGVRGHKRLATCRRLRATGVRGFATVLEWKDAIYTSNGQSVYVMRLQISLEGRSPWEAKVRDTVSASSTVGAVYTNAKLPVLVDPVDPRVFMVDWDA
jgi:hypothetical protein